MERVRCENHGKEWWPECTGWADFPRSPICKACEIAGIDMEAEQDALDEARAQERPYPQDYMVCHKCGAKVQPSGSPTLALLEAGMGHHFDCK